ncbi:ankyrin repeat-containing domain protein [Xylariaceae sp. FL1272]|nr:ankyrin repeat-containing domain protein [Xylariaceae sp. FL1272]
MSFGFGVGDFLAVIKLAHQLQKDFVEAPKEYKALAEDVRSLSIALQDAEISGSQLDDSHLEDFKEIVTSCKDLLQDLEKTLDRYKHLSRKNGAESRQRIKNAWSRLKFEPADVRAIRNQISLKITSLRTFNDRLLADKVEYLVQHQENQVRNDLLDWISATDMMAQQNDLVRRCQEGSRRWLFDSAHYQGWLSTSNRILFCHGKLGTGKTFTMAMVAETLRTINDASILTVYLYCSYRDRTQTVEGLLCSLLRGALEEATLETEGVVATCMQLRQAKQRISRQSAVSLLIKLFSRFSRVNLLVDALDELSTNVRLPFINDLLRLRKADTSTNLFLTTRDNSEIGQIFEREDSCTFLEIRASDIDIRRYISDNFDHLPKFVRNSPTLKAELVNSITSTSDGMFLVADLQLKSLSKILTLRKLRMELSRFSSGSDLYDKLYNEAMQRIKLQGPEAEQTALRTLMIVSCVRRPLSTGELIHALALDDTYEELDEDMIPEIDDVISTCDGLVVVDGASDAVRLVHKSTQDYFERNRSRWFQEAHRKVGNICVKYKDIADLRCNVREPDPSLYSFYNYATENWGYHHGIHDGEDSSNPSILDSLGGPTQEALVSMTDQRVSRQIAMAVVDVESNIVDACYAGNVSWVELLLTVRKYDINQHAKKSSAPIEFCDIRDNVLLTIAVAQGHISMVKMLLSRCADPNLRSANFQTPLMIAVIHESVPLVALLLEQPSINPDVVSLFHDPDCENKSGTTTAFLAAVCLNSIELVRLLIEKSDRAARKYRDRGAMWHAASLGYSNILTELLKWPDIECDYEDLAWCFSPLAAAIRNGRVEAALTLLPHAEPRRCKNCGQTAISTALVSHQYELLEHLVRHNPSHVNNDASQEIRKLHTQSGPDWLCPGPKTYHDTPLMAAVARKDLKGMQILLPYANVNQESSHKSRPLHEAAKSGDVTVVQSLLAEQDIEVDPVDDQGRSPFLVAAELGHVEVLKSLVHYGDSISYGRQDNDGHGAITYIFNPYFTHPSFLETIMLVLQREIVAKGPELLHQACSHSPEIQKDPRLADDHDRPFYVSRPYQDTGPFVSSLLKVPGINPNQPDSDGNTPLHLAVKHYQPAAVAALLIHSDINVDIADVSGNTAIFVAAANKRFVTIETQFVKDEQEAGQEIIRKCDDCNKTAFITLLNDGRSNLYDNNGLSILWHVIITGTVAMIQAVLDFTNLASELGKIFDGNSSMLSNALRSGTSGDVVKLLFSLSPHSVLHMVDDHGQTPLCYVMESYTDMIDTLVPYFVAAKVDLGTTNHEGRTALMYAVQSDFYTDTVRLLLSFGVIDVNLRDKFGGNALLYAASKSYPGQWASVEILRLLLDHADIDVNTTDGRGRTALSYVMQCKNDEMGQLLLDHRDIEFDSADDQGRTALSYASQYREVTFVAKILTRTSCVNHQDSEGRTALHYAALPRRDDEKHVYGMHNVWRTILALLKHPAIDIGLADKLGHTAFCYIVGRNPWWEDQEAKGLRNEIYRHLLRLNANERPANGHSISSFACVIKSYKKFELHEGLQPLFEDAHPAMGSPNCEILTKDEKADLLAKLWQTQRHKQTERPEGIHLPLNARLRR